MVGLKMSDNTNRFVAMIRVVVRLSIHCTAAKCLHKRPGPARTLTCSMVCAYAADRKKFLGTSRIPAVFPVGCRILFIRGMSS